MYRLVAKRLLRLPAVTAGSECFRTTRTLAPAISKWSPPSFCTTVESPPPSQNPSIPFAAAGASSTTAGPSTTSAGDSSGGRSQQPRAQYQDEQVRVLNASLRHVPRLGWTEAAMVAGARDVGVSPSIVGAFPRKEAALVEHFMDECLQKLMDIIDSDEELNNLIPSDRIAKLVRNRLELQAPYISKWPQALSIQAQPMNVPNSFKQRAMLVDEIWHAAGDESNDIDWYVKRTILGGIYSTTEIYMLTDSSPDFRDTWAFLNGRVRDAFDFKKSVQEAQYLAEAIGAGMGNSVQGFMNSVFKK
ncbi:Ubiquinone biosynthesis protein [Heracleum sosnowskyi]|uniref:Ubiquinone biosynthesis protein n=1 Tax=Heracleum sosnowskyi TaxID=360622 RepID=A0AAD8M7M4_9APIA|nr:Ubiquinone biosynthesis protein [Heracleum sosnowskyi]